MMTRCVVKVCSAVALLALAAGLVLPSVLSAAGAGQVSPPPRFDLVEQWLHAVEQHAPGVQDEAIRSVNSWSRDDLSQILLQVEAVATLARDPGGVVNFRISRGELRAVYSGDDLKRLRELGKRAESLGDRALLRRAVVLHTDAAVLNGGDEGRTGGRPHMWSGPVFVRTDDGQQVGAQEIADQFAAARGLFQLLPGKPNADEAMRLWYRATAAYLQREVHLDQRHIERGVAVFPKDPELLALAGTLHETFATPRLQQVAESARLPIGVSLGIEPAEKELALAEEFLRKTVGIAAQHTEARIRLGNVLGLRGHHKEAVAELERALTTVGDDHTLAYYARMFFAREAGQLGRIAQARASYEAAARLYPSAQSPWIALSQLAHRAGDDASAGDLLGRAFSTTRERDLAGDPWWRYAADAGRSADALIANARTALIAAGNR
jgi:tetratricopeptide (TPR) repeat protein